MVAHLFKFGAFSVVHAGVAAAPW